MIQTLLNVGTIQVEQENAVRSWLSVFRFKLICINPFDLLEHQDQIA